jgi:23S rRNA (cytidine1920-2'-O)/16S rRNA (cytidine1409-2'-O)-methyltransferase
VGVNAAHGKSAPEKKRLDLLMMERGLAESRAKAQALLLAGRVRVPGLKHVKAGAVVPEDQPIELLETAPYVSRGGEKLAGALAAFKIPVSGRVCWDVGASTGGFTDCLLQAGAARVAAIDVGHGQLHWKLRQDARVLNLEKTHILKLRAEDLPVPGLAVADLSFISLDKVLPRLAALLPPGAELIALVKPQFEAGPRNAPKGVVRDPEVRSRILKTIESRLPEWGFRLQGSTPSVLKGPKGNQEHFLYLVKND